MFNPKNYLESKLIRAGTYVVTPVDYRFQTRADGSVGLVVDFGVEGHESTVTAVWYPDSEMAVRSAVALAKLVDPSLVEKEYQNALDFLEAVIKAAQGKRILATVSVSTRQDGSLVNRIKGFIRLEAGQSEIRKRSDDVPF
jgi:hypothetical protein